jgi:hypothetical protein
MTQTHQGALPATHSPAVLEFKTGATYRTRDRREARIERISAQEGLIYGQVQMHGPCVWLLDGRYRDAPFGAAGPLDLMPHAATPDPAPQTASMEDALEGDNRLFCCD